MLATIAAEVLSAQSGDRVSPAETVRRLSFGVVEHVGVGLRDDATMLLVEYRNDRSQVS